MGHFAILTANKPRRAAISKPTMDPITVVGAATQIFGLCNAILKTLKTSAQSKVLQPGLRLSVQILHQTLESSLAVYEALAEELEILDEDISQQLLPEPTRPDTLPDLVFASISTLEEMNSLFLRLQTQSDSGISRLAAARIEERWESRESIRVEAARLEEWYILVRRSKCLYHADSLHSLQELERFVDDNRAKKLALRSADDVYKASGALICHVGRLGETEHNDKAEG
ncbi:hypothetical protein B0T26DRAFT_688877, partial [Lasiosphaeria miniovina]